MSEGSSLGSLLILLLPVLVLVFLFVTQRRRQREIQDLQAKLSVGDPVMTTSGLLGRVVALDPGVVTLDAGNGVRLRFDRRAIAGPPPGGVAPAHPAGPAGSPDDAVPGQG